MPVIFDLCNFILFHSCSFFEPLGLALRPVLPAPIVTSIMMSGGDATARLDLSGRHFTTRLTVWFGEQEVETIFRYADTLCSSKTVCTRADAMSYSFA